LLIEAEFSTGRGEVVNPIPGLHRRGHKPAHASLLLPPAFAETPSDALTASLSALRDMMNPKIVNRKQRPSDLNHAVRISRTLNKIESRDVDMRGRSRTCA
jgi:hypothetical protein